MSKDAQLYKMEVLFDRRSLPNVSLKVEHSSTGRVEEMSLVERPNCLDIDTFIRIFYVCNVLIQFLRHHC